MRYLFDTNTISEALKHEPNPSVIAWLSGTSIDHTFISVLALGEARKGVEKLADGSKRERIRYWLEVELPQQFGDRVLPIDDEVADRLGCIVVQQAGQPRPPIDCLLAAALTYGLTLGTRHTDLVSNEVSLGLHLLRYDAATLSHLKTLLMKVLVPASAE